jgi:hypothetical protein
MFVQGAKAVKAWGQDGGQRSDQLDGIAPRSDEENESGMNPVLNAVERVSF